MLSQRIILNFILIILISVYAFLINQISANIGVMPIDTFAFFDSGFSILKNKIPIRDFWAFTGLVVDYLQALFFWIFGENWNSYVYHACFVNIFASLSFYFFLQKLKLSKIYSFLYTISFATLCYPVSGTPFAYIHSYVFSLLSIFCLCIAIKEKNLFFWFLLPILSFFGFFSMQTPSIFIIFIVIIFSIYFFINEKNLKILKTFLLSGIVSFIFIIFYLLASKTPLENFLYQYFLFPLSIGGERLASEPGAYVSLLNQLNFNRFFGDFKFLHIFYLPLIFITIRLFYKDSKNNLKKINLIIIFAVFAFLFNQLITANQIFIFSLIPIVASILHLNLKEFKSKNILIILILLMIFFSTTKFHYRYNIDRKFHDLENVDKNQAVDSVKIDNKMKNLKWVTPYSISNYNDPQKEIDFLKQSIGILQSDKRNKVLITHYNFLSLILDEDLNLLNRWYLWENDTHPTETHKYFPIYKKMVNKNLKKNNIEVIYLLGQKDEILFNNVKNYFTKKCFNSKTIVKNRLSYHEIVNCKKK